MSRTVRASTVRTPIGVRAAPRCWRRRRRATSVTTATAFGPSIVAIGVWLCADCGPRPVRTYCSARSIDSIGPFQRTAPTSFVQKCFRTQERHARKNKNNSNNKNNNSKKTERNRNLFASARKLRFSIRFRALSARLLRRVLRYFWH